MKRLTRKHAELLGEIMADVARDEVMPRFQGKIANSHTQKTSSFDIVTEADEAAEQAIAEKLNKAFNRPVLVGEEATEKNPELLSQIQTAELAFIIDPIDGTKNYASGVPVFGMMISATVRGEVVLAAIHDPVCDSTSFALRGEGAWKQGNNTQTDLRVAAAVPVGEMHAVAGSNFLPEPLRSRVANNLSRIGMNFWLRCAAHEYRLVAAGDCHLLVYNRLMPWDHAAGWLLHREAGGYSAHFDGSPYLPSHTTGGLMCAPDQDSWQEAREALFGIPPN